MSNLFRKEAVEHQTERLWGEVLLTLPLPTKVLTLFLSFIVLVIIFFLVFGSYARKETVRGFLEPELGISQIFAGQPGRVSQVFVSEDSLVEEGQLLLTISATQHLKGGQNTQSLLLAEMDGLIAEINTQITLEKQNADKEKERLRGQLVNYIEEKARLLIQRDLLAKRISLVEEQLGAAEALIEKQYISKVELQSRQEALYAARQEAAQLEQLIIQADSKRQEAELLLEQLPMKLKQGISILKSRQAELTLRRTELDVRGTYSLKAPASGRISGLYVKEGQYVNGEAPLMSILPEGSTLQGILYVPTRAIGFIAKGQKVRLLYDAFPYQRFGTHHGKVIHVSGTILTGASFSAANNEPVYKITVSIDSQEVRAFGNEYRLQAGMVLNAEIVLEERSLLDWILEPLYSVKGRL